MMNVRIYDNGAAYLIRVNDLTVAHFNSLGNAWRHIVWMYRIETQQFTVGRDKVPVKDWIAGMKTAGYLD